MSFRFRKSFKIAPGVRLNVGKRSFSASVGPKGLTHTVGTAGRRTTAGIPGSGLSYTTKHKGKKSESGTTSGRSNFFLVVIFIALVVLAIAIF